MRSNIIIPSSFVNSKTKISGRRRKLLALLALVVSFSLALALICCHWWLLAAPRDLPSSSDEASAAYHSPAALRRRREEGGRRQRSMRDGDGRTPPNARKIPYIGEERFEERYSSQYKGVLPSSLRREQWTSPDPSCGRRPDFFDFFLLPKSERREYQRIFDAASFLSPPSCRVDSSSQSFHARY